MTRTAHDARFHPRAGDKSFRKNPPAGARGTAALEVVSVGDWESSDLTVNTTHGDGSVAIERLSLDVWADDYDGAWDYVPAPAERDPRTDPQVGDTTQRSKEGLGSDDPWRHLVTRRDGDRVWVETTYVDGTTSHKRCMAVAGWASDVGGWTWAVGVPAPDAPAPDAPAPAAPAAPPKAWWESRGLPECLATLPVPDDAALERLDFVREVLAAEGAVASVDSEGTVALGGLDLGTALWREGREVHYRVARDGRTVTGHAPTVPGALSEVASAQRWLRGKAP